MLDSPWLKCVTHLEKQQEQQPTTADNKEAMGTHGFHADYMAPRE